MYTEGTGDSQMKGVSFGIFRKWKLICMLSLVQLVHFLVCHSRSAIGPTPLAFTMADLLTVSVFWNPTLGGTFYRPGS